MHLLLICVASVLLRRVKDETVTFCTANGLVFGGNEH